jgi:glycosyltransferase involved in cell wall biosynthesis
VVLQRGDWLLVLGAPWIAPGAATAIVQVHERTGVRIALLVHDLLPATSPAWFTDAQGLTAKRDIEVLIGAAEKIFTVSKEVGVELSERYNRASALLNPADPVIATTLSRQEPTERCILSVGTLHPRKNLAALVRIWEAWAREEEAATGSFANLPTLLLVGRRHPQDAELFSLLATHRRAASKIRLIHTASDTELAELYAASRFLVMPSLAEGWGLPVREALVAGRPSIVTDAVPAASGLPYCEVVPAGDEAALGAAIRRWWGGGTPELLSERIRQEFKPRTWESVAADVSSQLGS